MRIRLQKGAAMAAAAAALALAAFAGSGGAHAAAPGGGNVRVTTADIITSDPYQAASAPFDVLQQNEPSIAQSPNHPNLLAVGVNDVRTFGISGDAWQGLSVSADGGATWPDAAQSLVPGYPGDTSAAGQASPIFGSAAASDPVLAFDNNYLYFSFIAFQRTKVTPASDKNQINAVTVARYKVRADGSGVDYDTTFVVERGTNGAGQQEDKEWIAADPATGALYIAYARFNGITNTLELQKSTDQAATWSAPVRLDESTRSTQFASVATGPDNSVYVAYRSYPPAARGQTQGAPKQPAIYVVGSTDGGAHFTPPMLVSFIDPYDIPASATPPHFRTDSEPSLAVSSNGNVWLAFDAKNGTTAGDDVNVVCSADGGATWSARKDPASAAGSAHGHQLMPSIAAAGGVVSVIWYDSRSEPAFDPNGPVSSSGQTGNSAGMDVYYNQVLANSCANTFDTETRVTSQSFNPNTRGSIAAASAFIGDYIRVVADADNAYAVWTDNRDVTDQTNCEDADITTNDTTCINGRSRDSNVYFQKIYKGTGLIPIGIPANGR